MKALLFLMAGFLFVPMAIKGDTKEPASGNPYNLITGRNAFGLKSPTPAETNVVSTVPLPEITLTGIADFRDKKWVVLVATERGKAPKNYVLPEGQKEDAIEVISADTQAGTVRLRVGLSEMTLSFQGQDLKNKESQVAITKFVDEHVRTHEAHQRKEKERLERERIAAAKELEAREVSKVTVPSTPK